MLFYLGGWISSVRQNRHGLSPPPRSRDDQDEVGVCIVFWLFLSLRWLHSRRGVTAAMSSLAQLEAYTSELVVAAKTLAQYCRNIEAPVHFAAGNAPHSLVPPEAPSQARYSFPSTVSKTNIELTLNRCRISSSLAYSGWVSIRCWPVYPSVAAFLWPMLPTLQAFQRRNSVV